MLTLALVEQPQSTTLAKGPAKKYTSAYYYKRIWNYKNISIDTTHNVPATPGSHVWEGILFDLNSLEPRCVLLVKPFDNDDIEKSIARLASELIKKLIAERIIQEQPNPVLSPKPF